MSYLEITTSLGMETYTREEVEFYWTLWQGTIEKSDQVPETLRAIFDRVDPEG